MFSNSKYEHVNINLGCIFFYILVYVCGCRTIDGSIDRPTEIQTHETIQYLHLEFPSSPSLQGSQHTHTHCGRTFKDRGNAGDFEHLLGNKQTPAQKK